MAAEVSGRVADVAVTDGAPVRVGEVLFLMVLFAELLFGSGAAADPEAGKIHAGALAIFLTLLGLGVSPLPGSTPESFATRIVPVYPSYGAPSAGAVIATGLVAGATAGIVAGAIQQPSTTVVTTAPAATTTPAGGTTLAVGMQLPVLPAGCSTQRVAELSYHRCGDAWVQPRMQGSQVVYVVVPAP